MKNMIFDTSAEMTDIYDLLLRLGVTANYIGFFHTAFAVHLAIQEPERLLLVTKCLYPEVAGQKIGSQNRQKFRCFWSVHQWMVGQLF